MRFETKIRKARFVVSPFSSEQMQTLGDAMCTVIRTRIQKGLNANDAPAKPLKPGKNGRRGYPEYKIARGRAPIRDWTWRGRTMASLKTKLADENRCTIGFIDPQSDRIAHFNNVREKAFGVSENDRAELGRITLALLKESHSLVRVSKAA